MIESVEYQMKKRLPVRLFRGKNDVYVTLATNVKAQVLRCQQVLDRMDEVFIHGLGRAADRAINVALQLQENGIGTVNVAVNTSTVELIDDFEPLSDELDVETRTRLNSAVHIQVYRHN